MPVSAESKVNAKKNLYTESKLVAISVRKKTTDQIARVVDAFMRHAVVVIKWYEACLPHVSFNGHGH